VHVAAIRGHFEVVSLLLKDPRISVLDQGSMNRTLFHCAAQSNQSDIIALLLTTTLDPSAADVDGNHPIHLAAESANLAAITSLLSDSRVNPHATNQRGRTPLTIIQAKVDQNGMEVSLKCITLILHYIKMTATVLDEEGVHPIESAAKYGRVELVDLYLRDGRVSSEIKRKVYESAAEDEDEDIVERLLKEDLGMVGGIGSSSI
jgi:ankyrin repeat protein